MVIRWLIALWVSFDVVFVGVLLAGAVRSWSAASDVSPRVGRGAPNPLRPTSSRAAVRQRCARTRPGATPHRVGTGDRTGGASS